MLRSHDSVSLWGQGEAPRRGLEGHSAALRASADEMSFLKAKGWGFLGVCLWEPLLEFLLHAFLFVVVS